MNLKKTLLLLFLMAVGVYGVFNLRANPQVMKKIDAMSEKASILTQTEKETAVVSNEKKITNDEKAVASFPPFPSQISIPKRKQIEKEDKPVVLPTTIEGGLVVTNDTSYDIDLGVLLEQGPSVKLKKGTVQVLIIHTHGSESYTPDGDDKYTSSDTYRTEDTRFNVVRVGDELAACLESYGISVMHDRNIYDYPSYTGSYARSGDAVARHLKENPEIAVVLDIHRDAIGNGDTVYKTLAESGGEPCSQVMMLVGTGENGLAHPKYMENLKLALYLQKAVVDKYPTLARPIAMKKERYNQQLTTGSLILEVGSSGNTLQEALRAIRLYADTAGPALAKLISE